MKFDRGSLVAFAASTATKASQGVDRETLLAANSLAMDGVERLVGAWARSDARQLHFISAYFIQGKALKDIAAEFNLHTGQADQIRRAVEASVCVAARQFDLQPHRLLKSALLFLIYELLPNADGSLPGMERRKCLCCKAVLRSKNKNWTCAVCYSGLLKEARDFGIQFADERDIIRFLGSEESPDSWNASFQQLNTKETKGIKSHG